MADSVFASSGRQMRCPTVGERIQPSGTREASFQSLAAWLPIAKPLRARSIASFRQSSSPSLPCCSASAAHPATAPGTVTDRGPSPAGSSDSTSAGAGPAASRACTVPPRLTSAKTSPPTPVDIGSQTARTAAAARAASTALPPRSRARNPARVADGWLVATIAFRAVVEGRAGAKRKFGIGLAGSARPGIDADGGEDDGALDDLLVRGVHVEQVEPVSDHCQQKHA